MKKLLLPLIGMAVIGMAACSTNANKSTDPALEAAVRATLESREFTVLFDRAYSNSAAIDRLPRARGGIFDLTSNYNIRISGDSIYSYLPYFGEAYTAVVGRQDGLVFDGPITGFTSVAGKKGATDIKFSARTFEDRYDFTLSVFPNGRSYLSVFPDRKSSISFEGRLKLDD